MNSYHLSHQLFFFLNEFLIERIITNSFFLFLVSRNTSLLYFLGILDEQMLEFNEQTIVSSFFLFFFFSFREIRITNLSLCLFLRILNERVLKSNKRTIVSSFFLLFFFSFRK